MNRAVIEVSPWDKTVFGLDCYEILAPNVEILQQVARTPGHYTIRVEPLASIKKLLHEYGFYYCDTLIEPWCRRERFVCFHDRDVVVTRDLPLEPLLAICHGAFEHGRFHRDFHLARSDADRRYDNWLRQLYEEDNVYGFIYRGELVGFVGCSVNSLVLHAVAESYRGRGLAKYLWSAICRELFAQGHTELKSSISAANLSALNLYASLGFRFRNAEDVYHRLVS